MVGVNADCAAREMDNVLFQPVVIVVVGPFQVG